MVYTPLVDRQFRLLRLRPPPCGVTGQSPKDKISCTLSIENLDANLQYEALSYAWGDSPASVPIDLDGEPFLVTPSLHNALLELRERDADRILWIDAICINQSNLSERGHQVSRMADIYGKATAVVVWLGQAWDGVEVAIKFISQIAENKQLHIDPAHEECVEVNGLTLYSTELRKNVFMLLNAPWWSRVWTVQEYVLARRVFFRCGSFTFAGKTLTTFERTDSYHRHNCCRLTFGCIAVENDGQGGSIGMVLRKIRALDLSQRETINDMVLESTLFRTRFTSEPLDTIYGILGLGKGKYASLIEPDYTLLPQQACQATAFAYIERTASLDVFGLLDDEPILANLPSFVPDFTARYPDDRAAQNRYYQLLASRVYKAGIPRSLNLKRLSSDKIALSGILFDTVTECGILWESSVQDRKALLDWIDVSNRHGEDGKFYSHTNEARRSAFSRTLCGNQIERQSATGWALTTVDPDEDVALVERWVEWVKNNDYSRRFQGVHAKQLLIITKCFHRRFFVTKGGYMGIGTSRIAKGDIIAVFEAATMPSILRPAADANGPDGRQSQSTKCYLILGTCYVHGIMDGEAFQIAEERKTAVEEIVLV